MPTPATSTASVRSSTARSELRDGVPEFGRGAHPQYAYFNLMYMGGLSLFVPMMILLFTSLSCLHPRMELTGADP